MGDADESYDFRRRTASLGNSRKALNWSPVAACQMAAEKSCQARCRFYTAGWATLSFHGWRDICSPRPFTMFIAASVDSNETCYDRLELQCEGMEFATEMIIKASLHGARIAEIPITLHPDGRKTHAPHLRTVRDGWRTCGSSSYLVRDGSFSHRVLFWLCWAWLVTPWRCPD